MHAVSHPGQTVVEWSRSVADRIPAVETNPPTLRARGPTVNYPVSK